MMVATLVIMTTFIIVFKECVDSLSSRGKKSTSAKNSNVGNSNSNTVNYSDFLKDYEFLNKPNTTKFHFPKLYELPEEKTEYNSLTGLINPFNTSTNNFITDFWKKESEKTNQSSYDLFTEGQKILDDWRREREEERRGVYNPYMFLHSEESEIRPRKVKKKSKKPDYPEYFE